MKKKKRERENEMRDKLKDQAELAPRQSCEAHGWSGAGVWGRATEQPLPSLRPAPRDSEASADPRLSGFVSQHIPSSLG